MIDEKISLTTPESSMKKVFMMMNAGIKKLNAVMTSYLNPQSKNRFIKILGFVVLLAMILLVFSIFSRAEHQIKLTNTNDKQVKSTSLEITALQQNVDQIQQEMVENNQSMQQQIKFLTQQLQTLIDHTEQLSNQEEVKRLSKSVESLNTAWSQQISSVQNSVNDVKQILQPHQVVDVKNLPFKVVSVDVWNGRPYATISMNGIEDLVAVNESRSGWTIDSMDFSNRQIVFRNDKDQMIQIQLET